MQHLEGSGMPVLHIEDAPFLKVKWAIPVMLDTIIKIDRVEHNW